METSEQCCLERYIGALPPELWPLANAVFEQLRRNPFVPIFSEEELAKLVCSPGFRGYLEEESRLQERSLHFA